MFSQTEYMTQLQRERRQLAIHNQQLEKSQKLQKRKTDQFKEELKKKDKQIHELEREKQKLKDELEKARVTIESYKQMLFQARKLPEIAKDNEEKKHGKERADKRTKTKKQNGQKKGISASGEKS